MKKLLFIFLFSLQTFGIKAAEVESVVILGGGIGGLTSALYMGRAGISPLVIEGDSPGGAIAQSPNVQNWPGELEITGAELAEKIHKQAEQSGARFLSEEVVAVDFSTRPFTITTRSLVDEKMRDIKTHTAIVALGSKPNLLRVPGEDIYWTRGVYSCAVCDGGLYKNQIVAVVGGGDAAITEAHYLSHLAKKVYVIVRKPQFRSTEEARKKELLSKPNVEVLFNHIVTEISGDEEKVSRFTIKDTDTHTTKEIGLDAVFLAIGATPNSKLFEGKLDLDPQGYILLKRDKMTSVEGVYALGDIVDPVYKQAISAAGDGAIAALQAEKYLSTSKSSPNKEIATSSKKGEQIIEINTVEQFQQEIENSEIPVLVDFYASWCPPCKTLAPIFQSWASSYDGRIKFLKVNIEKVPGIAQTYRIAAMPTLLLFDANGKVIEKKIGLQNLSQFTAQLESLSKS